MRVVSLSSLPVRSVLWQPRPNAWMFTFVCKATYALRPGVSPLAPVQEEPTEVEYPWSAEVQSIYAPCDLVPMKARPEVLLVGHAYAPNAPVKSLTVGLSVGSVNKALRLHGDRTLDRDGKVHGGAPFDRMPLLWERAAGGPGTTNPLGIAPTQDAQGNVPLPNIQASSARAAPSREAIAPVGYGPIAASWPQRREKLSGRAASLSVHDWHRAPLPEGIDPAFFNAAPEDQQVEILRDNEAIVLENLHIDHPRLITSLPGVHPVAFAEAPEREPQSITLHCDTLWIDTVRALCTLTWRGQVQLGRPDQPGRILVALAERGETLGWPEIEALDRARGNPPTARSSPDVTSAITPAPRGARAEPPPLPKKEKVNPFDIQTQALVGVSHLLPVVPFHPAASPPSAARESLPSIEALPFRPSGEAPVSVPAAPAILDENTSTYVPGPESESALLEWAKPAPSPIAEWAKPEPPPIAPVREPPAPPRPAPVTESPWAKTAPSAAPPKPPPLAAITLPSPHSALPLPAPVLVPPPAAPASSRQPLPPPLPAARPAAQKANREILELLWFDPESVPRMRRVSAWRALLIESRKRPKDKDLDDPAAAADPMSLEDRREVFELLARGEACSAEALSTALSEAVREDGKFIAPLVLVSGELRLPFDETESLKATVTSAMLVTGSDENLKAALENAKEVLKIAGPKCPAPVAEALRTRIKEAFAQGKKSLPADYLEAQAERTLLEGRHYQVREVFGEPHLRGLLRAPGSDGGPASKASSSSSSGTPFYLKEALSKTLPMFQPIRVRAIAEANFAVDQHEVSSAALKVVAIARIINPPGR